MAGAAADLRAADPDPAYGLFFLLFQTVLKFSKLIMLLSIMFSSLAIMLSVSIAVLTSIYCPESLRNLNIGIFPHQVSISTCNQA